MSKVVALIPARSGSKGVPNKNIRLLGGQPLLAWSIAACLKSSVIDRIIVSTDSREYAELATKYGAEAPFIRPAEISGDSSADYDFISHALDWLKNDKDDPEHIIHIRPTTPLRDPKFINDALGVFMKSYNATALRSVHEMSESAYKTFEISSNGKLERLGTKNANLDVSNNARQQFPLTYQANGYVDILSPAFIQKSGFIHGDFVIPLVTPLVTEVDTEDDFSYLEYELTQNPTIYKKLFS